MRTPKRLYEALPWIYIAAGAAVILSLRNWLAVFSGGMLIATGAMVLTMRARFRRPLADDMCHEPESAAPATFRYANNVESLDLARIASARAKDRAKARADARRAEEELTT